MMKFKACLLTVTGDDNDVFGTLLDYVNLFRSTMPGRVLAMHHLFLTVPPNAAARARCVQQMVEESLEPTFLVGSKDERQKWIRAFRSAQLQPRFEAATNRAADLLEHLPYRDGTIERTVEAADNAKQGIFRCTLTLRAQRAARAVPAAPAALEFIRQTANTFSEAALHVMFETKSKGT